MDLSLNFPGEYWTYKPGSPLKIYARAKGFGKPVFYLQELVNFLFRVFTSEGLVNQTNRDIIDCNASLEITFNRRAIYVGEIRTLILQQVTELQGFIPFSIIRTRFDEIKFFPQPDLRKLLSAVIPITTREITWYQAIDGFCTFVRQNSHRVILDPRNVRILYTGGTELEAAFKVTALHRAQVPEILEKQLVSASLVGTAAKVVAKTLVENAPKLPIAGRAKKYSLIEVQSRVAKLDIPTHLKANIINFF